MGVAGWISVVVLGVLSGGVTQKYLVEKVYPGQIWGAVIAGIIGSWIGGVSLGAWGLMLGGANLLGSLIVAFVLSYVVGSLGAEEKDSDSHLDS